MHRYLMFRERRSSRVNRAGFGTFSDVRLPSNVILRMTTFPFFARFSELPFETLSRRFVKIKGVRTHYLRDDAVTF